MLQNTDRNIQYLETRVDEIKGEVNEIKSILKNIDKKLFIGNGKPSILTTIELHNLELKNLKEEFTEHKNNNEKTKEAILKPVLSSMISAIVGACFAIISFKFKI